jgi:hypothetical protein
LEILAIAEFVDPALSLDADDRKSLVGKLDKALDEVNANDWTVVREKLIGPRSSSQRRSSNCVFPRKKRTRLNFERSLQTWRPGSRGSASLARLDNPARGAPLLRGQELDALGKMARAVGADVLPIASDDADIRDLARPAKFVSSTIGGQRDHWQDAGHWLIHLIALLSTLWFRPGWMVSTSAMS